jgi:hypothetical protein
MMGDIFSYAIGEEDADRDDGSTLSAGASA